MFVNTFYVFDQLSRLKRARKSIACFGVRPIKVIRNPKSKWFVTWQEFPAVKFDRYCTGFLLLISSDLIASMNAKWPYVRFFWIDDYWMTAMLGKEVGAKLLFRNQQIVLNGYKLNTTDMSNVTRIYGFHADHRIDRVNDMWQALLTHRRQALKTDNQTHPFELLISNN